MSTDKTALALRVLTGINNRQEPEPGDVALLRDYYADLRNLAPDELACIVIQETLEWKKKARESRRAQGA